MGDKLDKVLEGYKPIPMKRMMYPRGMKLSEDFVNAFHREFDRLVGEGANPKSLVERFGKALRFHQSEDRKYFKLDEEKAKKSKAEKEKEMEKLHKQLANEKPDKHEGDRGEKKREGVEEAAPAIGAAIGAAARLAPKAVKHAAKAFGAAAGEKAVEKIDDKLSNVKEGKKKKSRKGGTYGMGDSHAGDSDSD